MLAAALLAAALFLCAAQPLRAQDEAAAGPATLQIHPEAARLQAQSLIAEGNFLEAGRFLQSYLRSNPGDEEAWLLQAYVFENIQRYDLAIKAVERAGEIRGVFLAKARILFAQGDIPGATEAVRESLRRYPDFADAHHFLGYLLLTQKQYQAAADSLQEADHFKTTKVVPNAFYLGRAYYRLGRYDEAEERLRFAQQEGAGTGYEKGAADFLDLIELARNPAAAAPSAVAAAKPKPKARGDSGQKKKSWTAYASLLFEYDTNVELLPDSALALPQNDFGRTWGLRTATAAGGDWGFLKTGNIEFHVNGDLSLLTHFHPSGAKDAQILALQGGGYMNIGHSIAGAQAVWSPFILARIVSFGTFGTPQDFDADGFVDEFEFGLNDPFSIEIEPGVRFTYQRASHAQTRATFSYTLSRFSSQAPGGSDPQSLRDANTFRLTVGERWTLRLLNRDDFNLTGRVRFGFRNAQDANYDFWALEPSLRAEWQPIEIVVVELSLRYRYENHFKSPAFTASTANHVARTDQLIGAVLGARYRLFKDSDWSLWAIGQYLFEMNLSTSDGSTQVGTSGVGPSPDLQYDKHVISLGIRATF